MKKIFEDTNLKVLLIIILIVIVLSFKLHHNINYIFIYNFEMVHNDTKIGGYLNNETHLCSNK